MNYLKQYFDKFYSWLTAPKPPKTFSDITDAMNKYTEHCLLTGNIPTSEQVASIKNLLEITFQLNSKSK